MKSLQECITDNIAIPTSELETIADTFRSRSLSKGEYLLRAGSPCREMAYIESGYLRMYDVVEGEEITIWVGSEGSFITSLSSFMLRQPNYWNIQAVTDARLQVIGRDDHIDLLEQVPKWLEFDNLILTRAFAMLEQRLLSQLHTTARERYENLLDENPEIFNHVPLQHIASMLGIKPETLSRLRKNRYEVNS
ncbi:MAG: Crp/Fnr family transcriptional regulator [Balneolaceae bacterium]|nr:Crp/Fnr family transcriptional regulator [Balneolaceae bacterium]